MAKQFARDIALTRDEYKGVILALSHMADDARTPELTKWMESLRTEVMDQWDGSRPYVVDEYKQRID